MNDSDMINSMTLHLLILPLKSSFASDASGRHQPCLHYQSQLWVKRNCCSLLILQCK